ncbi:S8 family serine peptidase [Streptomyces sp. SH5]|uniref:S8 family peptidase n=1 Tax=Streptomyces sp. SH5 TaxID=3041765 RepID=UPI0024780C83|nr:S8 family serine peptidase [Streptomyces sp. SH5]WGP14620.1 S8 family serine peptidase [Streptomyces sp. SH5]
MTQTAVAQPDPKGASGARTEDREMRQLTLVTGDRVTVDAEGRPVAFRPAKGRENIPVQRMSHRGHTLVIPADAHRLIVSGKLDRRLFDVTELSRPENLRAQRDGLKLIVGYRGRQATAAKAQVRDAGSTEVGRSLKSLNAESVTTPTNDAPEIWKALTERRADGSQVTTAAGIDRVWLDGVRKASLDKSVPQIGTPAAWKAGYTGKGVKIAVLDTGTDSSHPDLKGQILAEKNFSAAKDTKDRVGHGTHVASIAAGTGAKSGGALKGVAPDAKLLSGKVLDDEGYGEDSGILAGMEWAVAQGADIVNLSLGGTDTPEVDPLEAAVDKLSAEKGVLFAVAAGNDGDEAGTVGSPGSADAALTVGAVDDRDRLAGFSSRGPRIGDGAIKPDVTAPGVDTTAAIPPGSLIAQEVGEKPAGYATISGTSMATPHVAGAAALLKQQHPDWKFSELKGALTASTKPGAYNPFQQGSGRIAVDRAIAQTVIAEPVSVSFGVQQWPHADDKPATEKVTYRNLGMSDVTLDLKATGTNPKGNPAPAGFFTVGADRVTVPAGGTAEVTLTSDTRLGGTVDGTYSAYLVATGGGQTVRTAAAVEREAESYDVSIKHLGRDGRPAAHVDSTLFRFGMDSGSPFLSPRVVDGTAKIRVPKGTYVANSTVYEDPDDVTKGADWIAQPKVAVTKNTSLTFDARKAKPVKVTVPDAKAKGELFSPDYVVEEANDAVSFGWVMESPAGIRTLHVGPQVTDGSLAQHWSGTWTRGASTEYDIAVGGAVKKLATGYERTFTTAQLAKVKVAMGSAAPKKKGSVSALGVLPTSGGGWSTAVEQKLPGTRTLYLSTTDKVRWGLEFSQRGPVDQDGWATYEADYRVGKEASYKAGKTYTRSVNTGVFGPLVGKDHGVVREGNEITGSLPLLADGQGNAGGMVFTSARTVLHRNGKKLGQNADPVTGYESFKVPAGAADYKLTTTVRHSAKVSPLSTRVDAAWTFRSKKTAFTMLPVSTVRFTPAVGADGRVKAGKTVAVPVKVHGAAAGKNLKSLKTYVSYNGGKTWKKVTVKKGKITVKNPAKNKAISFAAKVTDKKGNTSSVRIYSAYLGK